MKKKLIALGVEALQQLCVENSVPYGEGDRVNTLADKLIDANYQLAEEVSVEGAEPVVVSATTEKLISVRGMKDHDCTIGGVKVLIQKGKDQKLPLGIGLILAQSGIVFQTS